VVLSKKKEGYGSIGSGAGNGLSVAQCFGYRTAEWSILGLYRKKTVNREPKAKVSPQDETPTRKKQRQAAVVKAQNRPFEQKKKNLVCETTRKPIVSTRVIHVFDREGDITEVDVSSTCC